MLPATDPTPAPAPVIPPFEAHFECVYQTYLAAFDRDALDLPPASRDALTYDAGTAAGILYCAVILERYPDLDRRLLRRHLDKQLATLQEKLNARARSASTARDRSAAPDFAGA